MSNLSRVLEPEVMDTALEAADYDAMDHSAVNRLFVDDFLAACEPLLASAHPPWPILDLGAGTAQIPIELCGRRKGFQVVAADLAEEMLKLARHNVHRCGLTGVIECQLLDAKRSTLADASFLAVMSNSIVHHVPEPILVLQEAVRLCRPGGQLFFRDLLRPEDLDQLHWLVDTYAAGANDRQRSLFAASLHAALTVDEVRILVSSLGFSPQSVRQTSDRHWTWNVTRHAV